MHDVLPRREAARSPYEQNVLVVDESEEEKIYTPVGEDTNLPARSDNIERLASLAYGRVEKLRSWSSGNLSELGRGAGVGV